MKHLLTAAAFLFIAHTASALGNDTLVVKTQIYCSHCLKCGSCGENISSHVKAEKGITDVAIDPKTNTITVIFDAAKTNADKIRKAINKAGFDADDKKAPADAVNKLDGCCKKH
ncbi:MAG: hypothetical protein POELPBGB_00765 [Bacteroidia bacterium]|nr:hypothetical protein [Bacteroidia bacterium]